MHFAAFAEGVDTGLRRYGKKFARSDVSVKKFKCVLMRRLEAAVAQRQIALASRLVVAVHGFVLFGGDVVEANAN